MSSSVSSRWTRSISVLHLSRIDEERLPLCVLRMQFGQPVLPALHLAGTFVFWQETTNTPESAWSKTAAPAGDHTVHEVGLDDGLTDVALADWFELMLPLAGRNPAIPAAPAWCDEVLHPARSWQFFWPLGGHRNCQRTIVVLAEPVGGRWGRVGR